VGAERGVAAVERGEVGRLGVIALAREGGLGLAEARGVLLECGG
jgi:hypothetical protein